METLGSYTWSTTRGNPAAGRASFASDPVPGYANAIRINDTDNLGNDRSAILATVAEGDLVFFARQDGDRVLIWQSIVDDTPVNGTGFYGFPVTISWAFHEDDEPADDEEITAFRVDNADAGWPAVTELAQILNIAPDAAVTDWMTTLDRILAAAIVHVKGEVGDWDDTANVPNDNLAGAALRMAELMSQRPDSSNPSAGQDAAYRAFMTGQRKRFGLS